MANRLANEDSPYLLHHKENLVDWWPWCEEAFLKASQENKAIFISIGYSSSHWCSVMEQEVFNNIECANILNDDFVCIKVDREERPDIDKHFQGVYKLLNSSQGGWPTSIFCTPQNKPFFARTYLPAESVPGSNEGMGFKELSTIIATKVKEHETKLFETAEEVEGYLTKVEHPKEATVLKEEFSKNFMLQVKNNYDEKNGGFALAPKFPHISTLKALLSVDRLQLDTDAKEILTHTLNIMKKGGIYDLVDGGFFRYTTDEEWSMPHFEKMLYDNALLIELYTDAYLAFKDDSYIKVAKETADFWHNFLSEDGLFYSAVDANEESQQENYYLYTYNEVYATLLEAGYKNAQEMCSKMSIRPEGNYKGKNIIIFEDNSLEWFDEVKVLLDKLRSKRDFPFIDQKIQTSWSSMMIHSLFKIGEIDETYKQRAIKNLNALLKIMFFDGQLYHTTLIHKTPKVKAFLEDYAFLAKALITAFESTGDELYLINAQRFINKALEEFYDKGLWNFSVGEFVVKAEITDNTYTSAVGIMVDNLLSLSTLIKDEKYKHFAFKTLEYNSYEIGRKPIYMPYMLTQTLRYLKMSSH